MNTLKVNKPLLLTLGLSTFHTLADSHTAFYEPPMVSIPAGDFYMGSDRGREDQKPVHKVSVPAFQMGKHEVTLAEFRKFVDSTGYQATENCNHRIGPRWFGTGPNDGNWGNNIYASNEFYPVVCVSRTDAVNYAKWLSEQTGKQYRLPTEAEWEYTLRAGTHTRYFYGDEELSSQACQYANLSDYHARAQTEKHHGAAYNAGYEIQPCNDNEVLLSVVGIYQPNPFGVHDMLGNVVERLADCYQDSYENAPTDGSAVFKTNCDTFVARGGSWHWEAHTSAQRMRMGDDFLAALEGFRLVLDTNGEALPSQPGSDRFVQKLNKAQLAARKVHANNSAYPHQPRDLQLVSASNKQVVLQWSHSHEDFVTGYRVYRQDPISNQNKMMADKLKLPRFTDKTPLNRNARYTVVALNGDQESMPSDIVDSGIIVTHTLPAKIQGEAFYNARGSSVYDSGMEPADDKIIISTGTGSAQYMLESHQNGNYTLNARVFDSGTPQIFELWLGDQLLATPELQGKRGWTTIENIPLTLFKGKHSLSVAGHGSTLSVNWLQINAAKGD